MKKCEMCDENEVKGQSKYCDECKTIRNKEHKIKHAEKVKESKAILRRKQFEDNFTNINPSGKDLLQANFNKLSTLSASSYAKHYQMNWIDVIKRFGKIKGLESYVTEEYSKFFEITGSQDILGFAKSLGSHYSTLILLNIDKIREDVGLRKLRYETQDFEDNFRKVQEFVLRVPLYSEFIDRTDISMETYANRFNGGIKDYESIVKMYTTEEEFNTYKENQQEHKRQVGKDNHQGFKYTNNDLEVEFKRVFDKHIELTGVNPAMDTFNELSAIDDSVYRHRFNIPFGEIVEHYGYIFDPTNNKSEKLVIETIGNMLNESPIPQKTFDWLKSTKNYRLRCDGYYPSNKLVVEFDGRQHTEAIPEWGGEEAFINIQANDEIKDTLIPQHGLSIIRISCYDPFWDEDFLRIRLFEHSIMPPNHTLVLDSQSQQSKIA